jgi:hypothetical protein
MQAFGRTSQVQTKVYNIEDMMKQIRIEDENQYRLSSRG